MYTNTNERRFFIKQTIYQDVKSSLQIRKTIPNKLAKIHHESRLRRKGSSKNNLSHDRNCQTCSKSEWKANIKFKKNANATLLAFTG